MFTNKNTLSVFLMFLGFFFIVQLSSYASPTAPIVYVAWDGSGDYNCDGKADQVEINEALKFIAKNPKFTTVYIKGKHTYWIDAPLVIPSNIKLTGDSTAKIQLIDNVNWPGNKPMVSQEGKEHWNDGLGDAIYGTNEDSISNVEISGFEISGGKQKLPPGKWNVIIMMFYRASNLKIHDMNLNNSCGDIIRIMDNGKPNSKDVKIYNNRLANSGHEGMYLVRITNLSVYNNKIFNTRTNAGIRAGDCTNISIHGNTIGNSYYETASGYAGILVTCKGMKLGSAEIYDNYIYGKTAGIILAVRRQGLGVKNVRIHHNRIFKISHFKGRDDLHGGIRIVGAQNTIIEYNTIEDSVKDGIIFSGYSKEKLTTLVRNNIISNCGGYGIDNRSPRNHEFILTNNNIYNCTGELYHNSSSSSDFHKEAQYVNINGSPETIDLHLRNKDAQITKIGAYGTPVESYLIKKK